MKKLFLLLAMVGMLAVACEPGGGVEDENGNQTEQPGGNDTGSEDVIPSDKIVVKPAAMEVANEACDYIVTVYSPCSWRATTENEWITIETKLGIDGKRELIFSVADCYETEPREGKIIVSNNDEGLSAELTITQKAYVLLEENVIYYTSSDEAVVLPYNTSAFGANIGSNTYKNGQGIIIFDAPITWIGYQAFGYSSRWTSITIPDSVTSIGNCAFYYCGGLTSITIPDSVTEIGNSAFKYCGGLTSVYCKPTTPPTGANHMFDQNATGRKIYVPTASVDAYKSASCWSDYEYSIVGYDF